jgi:MSHA biogenesis protein MshJ
LRERYLLLAVVFTIVIASAQGVLIVSGLYKHDVIDSKTQQYKDEANAYQNALTELESSTNNPRIVALQNSNQQLENTIDELDQRIDKIASLLITPEQMALVLKQLLNEQRELSLQRFHVLPAKQLQTNTDIATVFYQHTIEITLTGEFEAFADYLESIETLAEELFWDDLLIDTQSFPTLEFRLKVHTLSRQQEWLNV